MQSTALQQPQSSIHVRDGKVQALYHWTHWNNEPWRTIAVERHPNGTFSSHIGSPDGGGQHRGTLAEVLARLHPNVRQPITAAFALTQADAASLRRVGLSGYAIDPA